VAAHDPQDAPGTMAQKPLWHCAGKAHVALAASAPVVCWHSGGGFCVKM
jgi:hypothetical protein